MPSHLPLISVALCTYNGEKFLAEQLESLVNQSYKNIEIIAADDGSTDSTLDILLLYAEKYPFFMVQQNPGNLGYVKNFEQAISLCNGEFIALSDQDDIWKPDKLELLLNNIGNYALIYHDSELISENGGSLDLRISDRFNMYEGREPYPFFFFNCISGHSIFFNASLRIHLLPFNEAFYHDWWIAIVATEQGGIRYCPEALVKYRQHGSSTTDLLKLKSGELNYHVSIFNSDILKWIGLYSRKAIASKRFIHSLLSCFKDGKLRSRFKLFRLLLSKYQLLFYRSKKSKLSKLNFIRKTSFSYKAGSGL